MFERFTDRTRMALTLAGQEAHRLDHRHMGTEHLLLGLMAEDRAGAALVLKTLGTNIEALRREVQKLVPRETDQITLGELPSTKRAKHALKYACKEARALGQNYVGTEHLLLGVIRDPECTAARVLVNLGLSLEAIRDHIRAFHGKSEGDVRSPLDIPAPTANERPDVAMMAAGPESPVRRHFSDRARMVMALANQEAHRFHHEYIGTEHILLGLAEEGRGLGATVLRKLNVDVKSLRPEIEKLVQNGPDTVTIGKLPLTPQAKEATERAIEEAQTLNHTEVGTEHILLGLLHGSEGIAAQVLRNLGLKLEDTRQAVLQAWSDDRGREREAEPGGLAYTQRGSPESPGGRDIPGRNEPAGLRSAEDLVVWQKADKLARRIYLLTSTFPHEEVLGMAARLREVALTLAPYIAEAYSRPSRKESRWLLNTAFGSLRQLRYLLGFSLRLGHLTPEDHQTLDDLAEDVYKLLWILYRSRR